MKIFLRVKKLKKIILTDKVSATMKVRVIFINSSLAEVECVCIRENSKHMFFYKYFDVFSKSSVREYVINKSNNCVIL